MPVKYVFVTGGVVSGLGKGITAASLGRLLKARGYTDYKAHDALEDVRATLHCYYAMQKDRKGCRAARRRKRGYDNRITGGGEAHCKQY